jgi:hypothetical protein
MLSNLSKLQTITLLHGRILKKMHIQLWQPAQQNTVLPPFPIHFGN